MLLFWSQDALHARGLLKSGTDLRQDRGIVDVNMGHLVIGHSKGFAGAGVEQFKAKLVLDRKPALLAKNAIQVDRLGNRTDAIFGKNQHLDATLLEEGDQVANDGVDALIIVSD